MADQGGGSSSSVLRDYRKGNWTVQETMILIEAKKMDDERRMKRASGDQSSDQAGGGGGRSKPAELRWKWVEDYCWRKGCFRSQNQCNDKWDNLMRDYKRVRDYERRRRLVVVVGVAPPPENNDNNNNNGGGDGDNNDDIETEAGSYWKIEKNVRKDKNLPSNMLPQIYDALVEVVERKGSSSSSSAAQLAQPQPQPQPQIRVIGSSGGGGYGSSPNNPINNMGYLVERLNNVVQPVQLPTTMPPPLLQHHHHHHISAPMQALPDLSPPPTTAAPPPPPPSQLLPSLPYSHQQLPTTTMCDSSDSDTSEYSDSPAKRRRKAAGGGGGGEGTSGGGGGANEVGEAISKSATIIAEAIQACEEREERRHRELLSLHERRLKIEESKTEINRQGINGLVDAINKLANSILALASHNKEQSK